VFAKVIHRQDSREDTLIVSIQEASKTCETTDHEDPDILDEGGRTSLALQSHAPLDDIAELIVANVHV